MAEFSILVPFVPIRILQERQGPPVRPLVDRLSFVKRSAVWGHYFRVSPIRLTAADMDLLATAVTTWSPA